MSPHPPYDETSSDAPENHSSSASHRSRPRGRPLTPDKTDEGSLPEPHRPPTPASESDTTSSSSSSQHRTIAELPPVPLVQKTWAKPRMLEFNKVRIKAPQGIPENPTTTKAKWTSALQGAGTMYAYTRLPNDYIRLMLLKPGSFDDDICVSLINVKDTDIGNHNFPYCALSYHWGDGDFNNTVFIQEDAQSKPIKTLEDVVNAKRPKKLKVKPNLYEILKRLRDEKIVLSIWVDAVCINQYDEDEKNAQVMKMALIYSKAYNVNIWLGSDDPGTDVPVSDVAMAFIPLVNDPNIHKNLLEEEEYIKSWASLFELLKWSWFSRRWVIQELALAQTTTVHCGKHICLWSEFQTAISIFDLYFDVLKPKIRKYLDSTHPDRRAMHDDSSLMIKHLGAKLLVDMTTTLYRKKNDGMRESTKGLETLVCSLSGFDTSDPRDTINALRNISRELNRPDSEMAKSVPKPDYSKDLFEVYREFVDWVVTTSASLNILCRFWALKERTSKTPTTPRIVHLPSWIQFADDSAWGKGEDMFNGRQAGDSFVGQPGTETYHASGQGSTYKRPEVTFPVYSASGRHDLWSDATSPSPITEDMSMQVGGMQIGTVTFRTDPCPDGVIPKECLNRLGWEFNKNARSVPDVPDRLWQTLVADRDPEGGPTPPWYKIACQSVLTYQSNNGHINIDKILDRDDAIDQRSIVQRYLRRVKGVTWNRSFIEGRTPDSKDQLVGFGPADTANGDIIVVMFGCSVPVILRPTYNATGAEEFEFVGEAYIYGKMDGEAFDEEYKSKEFRLI